MEDGAAFLAERVLPDVPCRQWVMSFPRRLRLVLDSDIDAALGRDPHRTDALARHP
jgi:hypothetical protein